MEKTASLALGSILMGFLVLGLKWAAFAVTGSLALYSDALESIVNVASALAAFFAVRYSIKPPDMNHPYGHHKAEYFSAVLEGVLIILAALAIFRAAWEGYIAPRALEEPLAGLLLNGFAGCLNGFWCWVLIRQGRRHRSPALIADGKHLLSDVLSSLGVLGGLGLALFTGWTVLDPLLAVLVALVILWSGWGLVKHSVGGLMDAAPPRAEVERIQAIIAAHAQEAIEVHDIRIRHAGRAIFINFHLIVESTRSVGFAHAICDRIEQALKSEVPGALITIHVEPEHKAKHRPLQSSE